LNVRGSTQKKIRSHENYPKNEPIVVKEDASLVGMISSTEIRRKVKENFGIFGLVTP